MSLRVTGGALRGRRLKSPAGRDVRPTSSRVREALFSILGQRLDGLRVLDLFAGAGTLGLEAGSRGAAHVVFIERDRQHADLVEANAAALEGLCGWRLLRRDARTALPAASADGPFDLVFLDPPYRGGMIVDTLEAIARTNLLAEGARVVVESDHKQELPESFGALVQDQRRLYKTTAVTIYLWRSDA